MTRHQRHRNARAAFTLVELMLGIAITALVALAIASMLTSVATTSASSRDDRSVLMRGNLANVRLRAYVEPALDVLAYDPAQGAAIWLQDDTPGKTVNLLELRILWYDPVMQTISVERVVFPGSWTQQMQQAANVALPKNGDFFAAMTTQRQAGYTQTQTLLEDVSSFDLSFPGATIQASNTFRFAVSLTSDLGDVRPLYVAVGQPNHTEPVS